MFEMARGQVPGSGPVADGGRGADGGPAVAAAPPADLASLLDGPDPAEVDDAALVEVVAAWTRVQSWAAGRAALAAAELARRPSMNPEWPRHVGRVGDPCVAPEELAMRLGWSRRRAAELVRAGRAFGGALWATSEALLAGEIDEAKSRILVRALRGVAGEVALAVQAEVLPTAPRRTHAQLASDVHRALVEVDPEEAAGRAALAVAERRVCRPRVLPDGMAGIWAVLPAPAAVAVHEELAALARAARSAGDRRTVDQLRADALCGALLGRAAAPPSAASAAPSPAPSAAAQVADDPLRRLVAGPPLRAEVRVVVSLDSLLGVGDGAAELDGYGALDPATAEALARGGTWRRLVTDPMSGTLLDVGRTRYRPPAGLATHVRTRDGTCVRRGCTTPATRCDIDHTVPFGAEDGSGPGGPTADANLGCLCERDHLLKTHGGFVLQQVAPGVFEWRTPAGCRYVETRVVRGARVRAVGSEGDGVARPAPGPEGDGVARPAPGPDGRAGPPGLRRRRRRRGTGDRGVADPPPF